jgi:hypothetical protein
MSLKTITAVWLATLLTMVVFGQVSLAQAPIGDAASPSVQIASDAISPSPSNSDLAVPENRWEQVLLSAEDYIASGQSIKSQTELYKELLDDVLAAARSLREASASAMGEAEALLDALGPSPDVEKNEAEPEEVADQRQQYQAELDRLTSAIARAEVAIVRIEALKTGLAGPALEQLANQLNQRTTDPWSVNSLGRGVKEFALSIGHVLAAPASWRASLEPAEWRDLADRRLPVFLAGLVATALISLLLRGMLKRRYGYAMGARGMTKARRLGAAVVRMVADGLMPALLLILIFIWSRDVLAGHGSPICSL